MKSEKIKTIIIGMLVVSTAGNTITPVLAQEVVKKANQAKMEESIDKEKDNDEIKSEEKKQKNERSNKKNTISIDKKEARLNEEILVSISTDLAPDTIKNVVYEYNYGKGLDSKYGRLNLILNKATGNYEGKIKITEDLLSRKIEPASASITYNEESLEFVDYSNIDLVVHVADKNGMIDKNPPVFSGVTIDKKEAGIGDAVLVSIEADDVSGIDTVTYNYMFGDSNNSKSESINFKLNKETGKYEGKILIRKDMSEKKIKPDNIFILDNAGNTTLRDCYGNEDLIISVAKETVADENPPIFNSVTVSSNEAKLNDKILVSVDVIDNGSGIKSVIYNYIYGIEQEHTQWGSLDLKLNEETGKYQGEILITDEMLSTKIRPSYIEITDKAGNMINPEYNYDDLVIKVEDKNGVIDKTPPVFNSITVSSNEARLGDEILVSVDAIDNESGIKNVNYTYSYGKQSEYWEDINLEINEGTGKYEGEILITEEMLGTKLKFSGLHISDKAGNTTNGYPDSDRLTIYVTDENGLIDREPPVFNSASVNMNEAKLNDEIVVSIDAVDEGSGIDRVIYNYTYGKEPNVEWGQMILEFNKITGKYEGEILVTEQMISGEIRPSNIEIIDKVGNSIHPSYEYEKLVIYIADKNGVIDREAPIFNSLAIDKDEVVQGEDIKVSVSATDKHTEISSVIYEYQIVNGLEYKHKNMELKLNEKNGLYEGTINTDNLASCKIVGSSMFISDIRGNSTTKHFRNHEYATYVTSGEGELDKKAPNINSFKVDKSVASVGEVLKFEVDATDGDSGVKAIRGSIDVYDGMDWVDFKYNSKTKKYEGEYIVSEYFRGKEVNLYLIEAVDNNSNYSSVRTEGGMTVPVRDASGNIVDNDVEIVSLNIDKEVVNVGDTVNFKAKLSNKYNQDLSVSYSSLGVSSVYGSVELKYNQKSGLYEGNLVIDEAMNGLTLDYAMRVYSNRKDEIITSKELGKSIKVNFDESISERPVFPEVKEIKLNKTEFKVGDELELQVKVKEKSVEYASIGITDGMEYAKIIELKYDTITDSYKGSITITDEMKYKSFSADYLYIRNEKGNYIELYDEEVSKQKFKVLGADNTIDEIMPVIEGYATINKDVKCGEDIKVQVKATDQKSGVDYVRYLYETSTGTYSLNMKYNSISKTYEGIIETENFTKGEFIKASSIMVKDKAGNMRIKRGDIDALNAQVIGREGENKQYKNIIKDISLDRNIIDSYEPLKVSMELNNINKEKVKSVTLKYLTGDKFSGGAMFDLLEYNSETNKYEKKISTSSLLERHGFLDVKGVMITFTDGTYQKLNLEGRNDLVTRVSDKTTGWHKLNGRYNYYINGKIVKGKVNIDGKTYFFDSYGEYQRTGTNTKPVITANNKTIMQNDKINLLTGVKAIDKEDGNLTSKVKVRSSNVNTSKVGTYKVVYQVTDSDGNTTTKEIQVVVKLKGETDFGNHWAVGDINKAMERGWVQASHDFRPNTAITRAEFIKIVNKAFGFKNMASSENFSDVSKGQWWYYEILIALEAGYISSQNDKFRPNDPITREEVASIVTSIKKNKDTNLDKIKKLSDYKKISSWARTSVEGAIENGYMGKGGTSFRPQDHITRAESVVTLSRIVK